MPARFISQDRDCARRSLWPAARISRLSRSKWHDVLILLVLNTDSRQRLYQQSNDRSSFVRTACRLARKPAIDKAPNGLRSDGLSFWRAAQVSTA
jgi:hypothetical protein